MSKKDLHRDTIRTWSLLGPLESKPDDLSEESLTPEVPEVQAISYGPEVMISASFSK